MDNTITSQWSPNGPGWIPTEDSGTITFTYPNITPPLSTNTLEVRKVQNGFVVVFKGEEYIFPNEYDIADFITKNLTK